MNSMCFQIAIDGPVAAGKGTVAKLVAKRLGFLYVDTGAMYRVATLLAKEADISTDNEMEIATLIDNTEIVMRNPTENELDGRQTTVIVNRNDVSWVIRTEDISRGVPLVARLPEVRKVLVKKQQQIAATQNVVMEGRDITYRVLPDAQLKIYLTGDEIVRTKRRHQELLSRGQDITFEQVLQDLRERDKIDRERTIDPLQVVPGAWLLDTTPYSIEDVVDLIENKVNEIRHIN